MNTYILYARKSQEDEGKQQRSISDQLEQVRELADKNGLTIAKTLTEERSAKEPYQRPIFDSMIDEIKQGAANAILCYHVNRLARNMVEGGVLQHLLTKGELKEIRTCFEVFRSGDNILPFILQTAMSAQFSLDLSRTVSERMMYKVKDGQLPGRAPEGYVNNPYTRAIDVDPTRFNLVRKAWDLMLTESYSLREVADIMNNRWGYRTRPSRRIGNNPIGKSVLYALFHNSFYTGYFMWKGELHKGTHEPMVTMEEFEAVQMHLGRMGASRPRVHQYAFTGLITCATCGRRVTAEVRHGAHKSGTYVYYHCANVLNCRSGYVRQELIDELIDTELQSVRIDLEFERLGLDVINSYYAEEVAQDAAQDNQNSEATRSAEQRLSRLLDLVSRDVITEEEFASKRKEVQHEVASLKLKEQLASNRLNHARDTSREILGFATSGPLEFRMCDVQKKKEIARKLAANYSLKDGRVTLTLHPLLVPLKQREHSSDSDRIEPGNKADLSTKKRLLDAAVRTGTPEHTLKQPLRHRTDSTSKTTLQKILRQVWDCLMSGEEGLPSDVAREVDRSA